MKTKWEINVIDNIGAIYIKNDNELSWQIGPGTVHLFST